MAIKITEKAFEEIMPFHKLGLGSVFIIKEGDVFYDDGYKYMKIKSDDPDCHYNSVNLTNRCFSLANISSDTKVLEIRAELILDDGHYDY